MSVLQALVLCALAVSATSDKGKCVDQYKHCPNWSKAGFCNIKGYKTYMDLMCTYSCNKCLERGPFPRASGDENEDDEESGSTTAQTSEETTSSSNEHGNSNLNNPVNPQETQPQQQQEMQTSVSREPDDQQQLVQDNKEHDEKSNDVLEAAQELYEDKNPPGVRNTAIPKDVPDDINPRSEITKPVIKLNAMVQNLKKTIAQTNREYQKTVADLYNNKKKESSSVPANQQTNSENHSPTSQKTTNQAEVVQDSFGSANQNSGSGSTGSASFGSGSVQSESIRSGSTGSASVDEMKDIAGEVKTGSKIFEEDITEPESTSGCSSGYGCFAGPGEQVKQSDGEEVQELESRSKIDVPEAYQQARINENFQQIELSPHSHGEDADGVTKATVAKVPKQTPSKDTSNRETSEKNVESRDIEKAEDNLKKAEKNDIKKDIDSPLKTEKKSAENPDIDASVENKKNIDQDVEQKKSVDLQSEVPKKTEETVATSPEQTTKADVDVAEETKNNMDKNGKSTASIDKSSQPEETTKFDMDVAEEKKKNIDQNVKPKKSIDQTLQTAKDDKTSIKETQADFIGEPKHTAAIDIDTEQDKMKDVDQNIEPPKQSVDKPSKTQEKQAIDPKAKAEDLKESTQKSVADIDAVEETKKAIDQQVPPKSIDKQQNTEETSPKESTINPTVAREDEKTTMTDNVQTDDPSGGESSGESTVATTPQNDQTSKKVGESKEDVTSGSGNDAEPAGSPKEDSIDRISKEDEEEEDIDNLKGDVKGTSETSKPTVVQGSEKGSGASETSDEKNYKVQDAVVVPEPKESDESGSGETEAKPSEAEESNIEDALFEKGKEEKDGQKQLANDDSSKTKEVEVESKASIKDLTSPKIIERIKSIEKLLASAKLKKKPYADAQANAREEMPQLEEDQSDEDFLSKKLGKSHDVSLILDQHFYQPYNNEDSMAYEMLALDLKKEVEHAIGGHSLVSQIKFSEIKKPGILPSYSKVLAHFKLFGDEEKLHDIVRKGAVGEMMVDKSFYQSS